MQKNLLIVIFISLLLWSCKDDDETPSFNISSGVKINYPTETTLVSKKDEKLTFTNLSTGVITSFSVGSVITLPSGLYDCAYEAKASFRNDTVIIDGELRGNIESIEIVSEKTSIIIEAFLFTLKDDFIIEEIFFSGTLRSSGSQYYGDAYVKLYNNTDHVLYADGVALCESEFLTTMKYDYRPNIQSDTMTIQAIYVVPGSGTDHPVMPGESFIICDVGIDHKSANPNSFDLSKANFEWYDVSNSPANLDIDSETVPNLDKWYCYTRSFWILHNRGYHSYVIARVPVDKETYLANYFYTYDYTMYLEAGTFEMSNDAYKLPNSWIIDGVNCSVESEREWNVLPPSIDAGWTHCGLIDKDANRYFKSVRRKMLYVDANGNRVLKDTDNSTNDFNTECTASIIEEQGTAIDASGTPAKVKTYDGVQVK